MVQSAVVRQIEVIGEAAKNISRDIRAHHPEVPWKEITAMRNILIHEYFQVDLSILWKSATEDIPNLKSQIQRIIKNLEA